MAVGCTGVRSLCQDFGGEKKLNCQNYYLGKIKYFFHYDGLVMETLVIKAQIYNSCLNIYRYHFEVSLYVGLWSGEILPL
jgi:hypothetical protein